MTFDPDHIYEVLDIDTGAVVGYAYGNGSLATEEQWQKQEFGETETEYYDRMMETQANVVTAEVDDWGVPFDTAWNRHFK